MQPKPTPDISSMTAAVDQNTLLEAEACQIKARRDKLDIPYEPHAPGFLGVAFSGGGIRSGTFNLGILQGLARVGLLPYIDYLSTVSGGGYIGTWLHGVIKRFGLDETERILRRRPDCEPHGTPSEDPIAFLRKYSSYLAPDLSLLSADFWVILVIWFRNMFLNLLMLIPFLALIVLFSFHAGFIRQSIFANVSDDRIHWVAFIVGVLLLLAVLIAGNGVRGVVSPEASNKLKPSRFDRAAWAVTCAALMLAAAVVFAWSSGPTFGVVWSWTKFAASLGALFLLFFILQAGGGFLACYCQRHKRGQELRWLWLFVFPAVAAAGTAALIVLIVDWTGTWRDAWHTVAYGPPLVGLIFILGAGLHIGLMAADFPDAGREWFARVGAFLSIFLFAWAALFTICVLGPPWISAIPSLAAKSGVTAAWMLTTAGGVLSGMSSKTSGRPGDPGHSKTLEIVGQAAPPVFVIGLMLLISYGTVGIIHAWMDATNLQGFQIEYWNSQLGWAATSFLTFIFLVALGLLPLRININEFSMHYFYKNRLVRCYLGASHQNRKPSRLTGFDSSDDFPLATLLAKPETTYSCHENESNAPIRYSGPYPILCATLNLNTGTELAKRERKGTSFIFTPLYSGYVPPRSPEDVRQMGSDATLEPYGFRRTCEYSIPGRGLDIGTCMGISGAAANPDWGYHTSAAVAFLLTVFDVRLGWWIGNSRRKKPSSKIGPRWALIPLLSELFAQTDERSAFFNLSDGGHFENLGLYELIRRRCRYIIVGDGEQDTDMTFGSLGGAIRKSRIDFGVSIDLNPRPMFLKDGLSTTHCVVGRINYPATADARQDVGWILYLKSSLTGDEPEDVAQYKSAHPDFPQETTANQFFTESQFESYRRLGLHVVESAFGNVAGCGCKENSPSQRQRGWVEHLFRCLEQQWYPPTDIPDTVKSRHAETYTALLARLSQDADLRYFDAQIIAPPGLTLAPAAPPELPAADRDHIQRRAFFYCLELIQLMENVWADLQLQQVDNRENPKNKGWLTIFRFWARQPLFKKTWEQADYTFNPLFQQFFNSLGTGDLEKNKVDCHPLPVPED